jgi:hypothetical protein
MSDRKPLSKKVRFDVFKRDGFACQYCGRHPPEAILECDHIVSVRDGGTDDANNLVTACFGCNRGKGAEALTVVPKTLAAQGEEIKEREEQLAGYRTIIEAQRSRIEDDIWRVAEALFPGCSAPDAGLRRDWATSIKRFVEKMDIHDMLDAAEIALSRKLYSDGARFRYFCGICWNKIRDKEDQQ